MQRKLSVRQDRHDNSNRKANVSPHRRDLHQPLLGRNRSLNLSTNVRHKRSNSRSRSVRPRAHRLHQAVRAKARNLSHG